MESGKRFCGSSSEENCMTTREFGELSVIIKGCQHKATESRGKAQTTWYITWSQGN